MLGVRFLKVCCFPRRNYFLYRFVTCIHREILLNQPEIRLYLLRLYISLIRLIIIFLIRLYLSSGHLHCSGQNYLREILLRNIFRILLEKCFRNLIKYDRNHIVFTSWKSYLSFGQLHCSGELLEHDRGKCFRDIIKSNKNQIVFTKIVLILLYLPLALFRGIIGVRHGQIFE